MRRRRLLLCLLAAAIFLACLLLAARHRRGRPPATPPPEAAFTDSLQRLHKAHADRVQALRGDEAAVGAAHAEHRKAVAEHYRAAGKPLPPGIGD